MDAFTEELLRAIGEAEKLGLRMKRLRADVEQYGGVQTVREYLRRDRLSDGFQELSEAGRLELSMEALAVRGKYGALFSDDEINRCFERLCGEGYFSGKRKPEL